MLRRPHLHEAMVMEVVVVGVSIITNSLLKHIVFLHLVSAFVNFKVKYPFMNINVES
jgi:hypothetical protein